MKKKKFRRPVGKRFDEKHRFLSMKQHPSQMMWETFSNFGSAGLYVLPPGTAITVPGVWNR